MRDIRLRLGPSASLGIGDRRVACVTLKRDSVAVPLRRIPALDLSLSLIVADVTFPRFNRSSMFTN